MSYESDGDFFGLVSMQNKGWLAAILGLIAIAFWMVSLSQRHDCASEVCPFSGQRPVVVEKSCVCVNEPLKTTGGTEVVATRFPEVHGLVQTAGAELGRQAIRRGRIDEELLRRADTVPGGRVAMLDFLAKTGGLPKELAGQVAQAIIDMPRVEVIYLGPASEAKP